MLPLGPLLGPLLGLVPGLVPGLAPGLVLLVSPMLLGLLPWGCAASVWGLLTACWPPQPWLRAAELPGAGRAPRWAASPWYM